MQAGADADGTSREPHSTLVTTLHTTAPLVLLNASLGDEATIQPSGRGCVLARAGWMRKSHSIRSRQKLNPAGMTLLDTDLIRLLEERLPSRFGGGPSDYQLVEDLTADGRAPLRLLIHPRGGLLDEAAVIDRFFAEIGAGGDAYRLMEIQEPGDPAESMPGSPPTRR